MLTSVMDEEVEKRLKIATIIEFVVHVGEVEERDTNVLGIPRLVYDLEA